MRWDEYPAGVAGDVRLLRDVASGELGNSRDLHVYLPPSYARGNRDLAVVYMHDGQNLFHDALSYAGEWRVDETMEELAREGVEAAVVGIANAGEARGAEYSPWPARGHGGDADAYLRFVAGTVRPLVAERLGLAPPVERVGIAGSSLGGLVSLYGLFARPDAFGFAGAFSPAFWWAGERIYELVETTPPRRARVYLDAGGREGRDERMQRTYVDGVERMAELLRRKGYGDDVLRVVVDEEARHDESAWAARFPGAMRFLLAPGDPVEAVA